MKIKVNIFFLSKPPIRHHVDDDGEQSVVSDTTGSIKHFIIKRKSMRVRQNVHLTRLTYNTLIMMANKYILNYM